MIPDENRCAKPRGRFYVLNTLTGLPAGANLTGYPTDAGFPGIPVILASMPLETAERDATGKRRITRKIEARKTETADSDEQGSQPENRTIVETVTTAGRLSWREIVNWLELRNDR